tara:strand:+ start:18577 stop:20208 length:1632 start_codon:yes stop_codon:yes gene_type:complete
MNEFLISARKYRPSSFNEVLGQKLITKSLENAIANNKLAQAILFTGPRGVGKTSCARIVARKLNNFEIDDDNSYNIFELDAASNNGVEGIRNLIDQTRIPPQTGKYKVYIIDEVHMLSTGAFNAFLKTLEEPPKHCVFILATTEKHKIIPTILSRCQIYNFKRINNNDIVTHLKNICSVEKIKYEDKALEEIANKSDGAMRDALQLFDKIVSLDNVITLKTVIENLNTVDIYTFIKIYEYIYSQDIPNLLNKINEILENGISGDIFISGLSSFFRDLLVSKNKMTENLTTYDKTTLKELSEINKKISYNQLIDFMSILNDAEINFQKSINQRLLIELTLLKITSSILVEGKKKLKNKLIPTNRYINQDFISKTNNNLIKKINKPVAKIQIDNFKTPTLSLKSIITNKEIEEKIDTKENLTDYDDIKEIDEVDIIQIWNEYSLSMENIGKYNIASILRISTPSYKNNIITYTVPNNTSKLEIDLEKQKLITYFRNKFSTNINLEIKINKAIDEKFAYTNKDKYDLLKTKNKSIMKLKEIFNLSI